MTDADLMRGVDYRVEPGTEGISLLLMSGFESTRAYIQALGRVGRFDERSKRFLWKELKDPVNKLSEIGKVAELRAMKFAGKTDMKVKKSKKKLTPPPGQPSVMSFLKKKEEEQSEAPIGENESGEVYKQQEEEKDEKN